MKKKNKSCWYKTITEYCEFCGYQSIQKKREYGSKPKLPENRSEFNPICHWCDAS